MYSVIVVVCGRKQKQDEKASSNFMMSWLNTGKKRGAEDATEGKEGEEEEPDAAESGPSPPKRARDDTEDV